MQPNKPNNEDPIFTEPIEEEYRVLMAAVAAGIDIIFNEDLKGPERKTGFVLLVFPFGESTDGRCNYISNGADRADMVKLFREQANRFDLGVM